MMRDIDHSQLHRHTHQGTTLVELVVAISLMVVIMGTIVPLIASARLTWDASSNNADAVQNGRIIMDHLYRHLSQAASIKSASRAGEALGYIEFKDYTGTTYRYDISGANYVEYGQIGSLIDIAGPVSQLQFTCYDGNDMASGPITDVSAANLIKIEVTVTHRGELAQDKVFSTSVFLNGDTPAPTPHFDTHTKHPILSSNRKKL